MRYLAGLLAVAVWGQTIGSLVERTIPLQTETNHLAQELSMSVRNLAEIQDSRLDLDSRVMVVRSSAPQVALAEWTAEEMQQPRRRGLLSERMPLGQDSNDVTAVFAL